MKLHNNGLPPITHPKTVYILCGPTIWLTFATRKLAAERARSWASAGNRSTIVQYEPVAPRSRAAAAAK